MVSKVLVIGSVSSTQLTLKALIRHGFNVVGVMGYEPTESSNVSGFVNLQSIADEYAIPYIGFQKINEDKYIQWASEKSPEVIFAVGFSQLLNKAWLDLPELGVIGFHPTCLPQGRGRAPQAWAILDKIPYGAATFFLMGEGADNGPIFVQERFEIDTSDNNQTSRKKLHNAITKALNRWLPKLALGTWDPIPQEESKATYYGVRKPKDGLIDWNESVEAIDRLIRATSKPYPGAYTYYNTHKIIIWESTIENQIPIRGVVGRILLNDPKRGCLVQCGQGKLWINSIESDLPIESLKVGYKLGIDIEDLFLKVYGNNQ